MKKLLLLVILSTLFTYAAQAQKIDSLQTLYLNCLKGNDSLYFEGAIHISNWQANQKIIVEWGDGKDTTINRFGTPISIRHWYTSPGLYSIKTVIDTNNKRLDSTITSIAEYCNFIHFYSYQDSNSNCKKDTNEKLCYSTFDVEIDSGGVIIDTISLYGGHLIKSTVGAKYKFKIVNAPTLISSTCLSDDSLTITGFGLKKVGIGARCSSTSQYDMSIDMSGTFRPVNTSKIYLTAKNNSCNDKNAVVKLYLTNKYKFRGAWPFPSNINGNIFTWNLTDLSIIKQQLITILLDTATTLSLSDTVCNYATITPFSSDIDTTNNEVKSCDSLVASLDPNDKHVTPSGDILPGTKLTYTINFENLGNDTAFNVVIRDTLSENLNISTLKVLNSSHNVSTVTTYNKPIGKNIINFNFANIHLADKTAPNFNKGFVIFTINAKQALAPTTKIENRAGIYFDINPVVLTNTTENIVGPLAIGKINIENSITIYPNPTRETVTLEIDINAFDRYKLYNSMGQFVSGKSITSPVETINMKNFPSGVYYIQLTGRESTVTQSIQKL